MPGVTSLSVLFLLLALCPLDVAGLRKDIQVMFLRKETGTFSVMDLSTDNVTDLFTIVTSVYGMDYDPVNQKVYWCSWDRQCYVQDYEGSNQTVLFNTQFPVKDLQVDENSTLYYLGHDTNMWVKKEGEDPVLEKTNVKALSVDKANGRVIFLDLDNTINDLTGVIHLPTQENISLISWNSWDEELYFVVDSNSGSKIKAMRLDGSDQRTIVENFQKIPSMTVYRDVIVFTGLTGHNSYHLYAVSTKGTNLTTLTEDLLSPYTRPVPFQAKSLIASAATDQSSVQGCLQTNAGTSIKVTLAPGLEDFNLLVMDPPMGCSRDLGQFRQDITIPESCFVDQEVEVAIQLTEIKDILGGRFFRHFLFSCSDLGPDGTAVELTADTNPDKTQATASNTSYADGYFHMMIVTSANLNNRNELTTAKNLIWSQNGIYLVLRHRLALGSQHRTLIPTECTINSTSHPEKKTMWLSKPDMECKQEMGLIDAWTIQSQRTPMDDVAYTQLFPFDFQVGEEVTITCNARECPYVADAGQLQGKCMEAFKKYKSCGGTFQGSSPKRRREVTSLSRNGFVPWDQAASRVMSASFTLV